MSRLAAADNLGKFESRRHFKVFGDESHEIVHEDHSAEHSRQDQQRADKAGKLSDLIVAKDHKIKRNQKHDGKIRPHDSEGKSEKYHGKQGQIFTESGSVRGFQIPDHKSHENHDIKVIACLRHAGPCIPCSDQLRKEKECRQKRLHPAGTDQSDKNDVGKDCHNNVAEINIIVRITPCYKRNQIIRDIGKDIIGSVRNIAGSDLIKACHTPGHAVITQDTHHTVITHFIIPCCIPGVQLHGTGAGKESDQPPCDDRSQ